MVVEPRSPARQTALPSSQNCIRMAPKAVRIAPLGGLAGSHAARARLATSRTAEAKMLRRFMVSPFFAFSPYQECASGPQAKFRMKSLAGEWVLC